MSRGYSQFHFAVSFALKVGPYREVDRGGMGGMGGDAQKRGMFRIGLWGRRILIGRIDSYF